MGAGVVKGASSLLSFRVFVFPEQLEATHPPSSLSAV